MSNISLETFFRVSYELVVVNNEIIWTRNAVINQVFLIFWYQNYYLKPQKYNCDYIQFMT